MCQTQPTCKLLEHCLPNLCCWSHSGCLLDLVWGLAEACCCTALNIAVRQLLWQCVARRHVKSPSVWLATSCPAEWLSCGQRAGKPFHIFVQTDKTMLRHLSKVSHLSTCYTKAIECDCMALQRVLAPKQDVSVLANLQWQRAPATTNWAVIFGLHAKIMRHCPIGCPRKY